jgi:hypothetical protein
MNYEAWRITYQDSDQAARAAFAAAARLAAENAKLKQPFCARWYCMASNGLATLCANEQDARTMAEECDASWPKNAPHRAVLLGNVAALREVARRLVAGIDHLDKLAREWEPDSSSGADRRGWILANDAREDAVRILLHHVDGSSTGPGRSA